MDWLTITIIITASILLTTLAVLGWQLDNDTHHKP
jgi:hypothetical protein